MTQQIEVLVQGGKYTSPCTNTECNRPRADFLMAFRDEPYCSDNCRKAIGLDPVK